MLLDAALNPEKPVTALEGYEECYKFFSNDVQSVENDGLVKSVGEIVPVTGTSAATDGETVATDAAADDAVATDAGNVATSVE